MPDSKISALTNSGRPVFDDETVTQRGGTSNLRLDIEDLQSYSVLGHPRRRAYYYDDFVGESTTGAGNLFETNSGTAAATDTAVVSATNVWGMARHTTGSTATGRTALCSATSGMVFSAGVAVFEWKVLVATLSDATQRYQYLAGFIDTLTAANQVDGIYFLYDEGGVSTGSAASANWQIVTSANSVRTFTTTAAVVGAAAFVTLRAVVNAAGTSVEFFIDGTSRGTHATNIPTGTTRVTGCGSFIIKSIGTTARTIDLDYVAWEFDADTARGS